MVKKKGKIHRTISTLACVILVGGVFFQSYSRGSTPTETGSPVPSSTVTVAARVRCKKPSLQPVVDCLQLTNPNLTVADLEYPDDAFDHFLEIHKSLQNYTNNADVQDYNDFAGPWIENVWIAMSWRRINESIETSGKTCSPLVATFGPYIPLLINWVDIWMDTKFGGEPWRYPEEFTEKLDSVLRPNVPYMTVSQNAQGVGAKAWWWTQPDNLLVFSSGGYGHVPIPLFKQDEPLWKEHRSATNRSFLVNYVGSKNHDPMKLRRQMHRLLERRLGDEYKYFYGAEWRDIMKDSWISMAPRGYGRTAFHLVEALQMGLIPVHVYAQTKWVPYEKLYETLGFSTNINGLKSLISRLSEKWTTDDFLEREDRIASFRESHFTKDGAIRQVYAFLSPDHWPFKSDLICQALPETTTMS